MIATYHNSTVTAGNTDTFETRPEYNGTPDTGTVCAQGDFCIWYYVSPKTHTLLKIPNHYPAIPWDIKPIKNIITKPIKNIITKTAHRIKQPVSRSGFYRGQRMEVCNVHAK